MAVPDRITLAVPSRIRFAVPNGITLAVFFQNVGGPLIAISGGGGYAAALDFSEKYFDEMHILHSIVLFDENSQELSRVFPGRKLCIDLAFSPDGKRLAALMCTGKKQLPKSKKVRAGECLMVWDLNDLEKVPKPLTIAAERASATPVSERLAKMLGKKATRSLHWTKTELTSEPADGKKPIQWAV